MTKQSAFIAQQAGLLRGNLSSGRAADHRLREMGTTSRSYLDCAALRPGYDIRNCGAAPYVGSREETRQCTPSRFRSILPISAIWNC